jgi:sterol desaturase/sphingolipid hydroxylase (fatty acid hydroxylase superfamily)
MVGLTDGLINAFDLVQQWLFEQGLQPLMFALGFGDLLEDGYAATGWLLVGLMQIVVMLTLLRALERWRPVEAVSDHAAVRVDMIYTLIHRLGLFRIAMFFAIGPWWDWLAGALRLAGVPSFQLDAVWPGVSDIPWVSFGLYLLVFDFVNYWLHRAQHQFSWWWALHALHHSQRQMTLWSDNRNHLLDSVLMDSAFVLLARFIGVEPGQFIALAALAQLLESLQHANVRLWFGPWLERVLVSPRFHRRHHSIGIGHESQGRGTLGGCNFAVLLPIWDLMFGTADFRLCYEPTGIRDQLDGEGGRDYGRGFWAQQWLGLRRLFGRG